MSKMPDLRREDSSIWPRQLPHEGQAIGSRPASLRRVIRWLRREPAYPRSLRGKSVEPSGKSLAFAKDRLYECGY